jgi:hypothetical protein
MNEQEFMKQLAPIMTDERMLEIHISIRDLWFVDSVLSLAWRHPDLSLHQRNWIDHLHNQIVPAILEVHPEAAELLKAGWDVSMDQPIDRNLTEKLNEEYRRMEKKYLRKTGRI